MKKMIIQILHFRMTAHYPEKVLDLLEHQGYTLFLESLADNIWEQWYGDYDGENVTVGLELIRSSLIDIFGPSRFDFIETLIAERFSTWYASLVATGIAKYELLNIQMLADPFFEQFPLNCNDDPKPQLTQLIIAIVKDYRKSVHIFSLS